jgi:hypothetical protein
LIAGEYNQEGLLPTIEDISWRLRIPENEIIDDLNFLEMNGILTRTETDNIYSVTKFSDRQSAMTGAERIRRFRETQRKDEYYSYSNEPCNEDVTNRSQIRLDKIRSDKDIEEDYITAFCQITGIGYPFKVSTHAKWIEEVGEWVDLKISREDIQNAYKIAIEKKYTVARPGGLTSFLRGNIAKSNAPGAKTNEQIIKEMIDNGEL